MKIAIVSTIVPNDLRTGSEIATLALVQTLESLGHEVTVYAYGRNFLPLRAAMPAVVMATIPITTADTPLTHKLRWLGRSLRSGLPISSEKYNYVPPDRIAASIMRAGTDLLLVDHINLYPFVRGLAGRLPFGVVFHDIQAASYARVAEGETRPLWRAIYRREARLNAILEAEAGAAAGFSWFLNEADAVMARARFANPRASVVPLFYPFPDGPPAIPVPQADIGLIGTWSWPPVAEGMRWFLDKVLPLLPADVTVAVAGNGSEALPSGRIRKLGMVPDARAFLAGCWISAVPSVAGTGLQIKTLELAAIGMPAVSTTLGVRGLGDLPPILRVADDPRAFAAALMTLLAERRAGGRRGPEAAPAWNAVRRAAARAAVQRSLETLVGAAGHRAPDRVNARTSAMSAGQQAAE